MMGMSFHGVQSSGGFVTFCDGFAVFQVRVLLMVPMVSMILVPVMKLSFLGNCS